MVFYPSRDLNFGDHTPVREFVRERLVWIELAPERLPPTAPPLQRALAMLLLPEEQLPDCYSIGTPRHTPALETPRPQCVYLRPPPRRRTGHPLLKCPDRTEGRPGQLTLLRSLNASTQACWPVLLPKVRISK